MKQNARIYAQELYNTWTISKEGPGHSLKIAKKCLEGSNPKNWQDLPVGPVFATKGYGSDKWDFDKKSLNKTYNFWNEVVHILKKKLK